MDQTTRIREKIDIVSFISEYLPLKKMGRNFTRQCPFHNEKSPSFVVSPERQIWHCFGCNKGGDIFTFLMEYERLEFIEALRILAKKAGVEMRESSYDKTLSSQKETLYRINRLAAEFYHFVLVTHTVGKQALGYLLENRAVHAGTINMFLLGLAPKAGNVLSSYLVGKKKYKEEDVVAAGLGTLRNGRLMDFFVDRIMFPLTDHRGNIIGFSGRVFSEKVDTPKYINTRETTLYHKGSVFFGLDSAKEEIKKHQKAIIVEGELDVISCFQNGIKNVVAIKGTALTENQVNLLGRFTQKIALCLDEDRAGQEAIKRSLPILEKKGITTTIIVPSGGKDADESLKKDPYAFKHAVEHDAGVYDYLFEKILSQNDKSTAEGKRKIAQDLLSFFHLIENEIVKEHFLRRLSVALDTSYESIARQADKIHKTQDMPIAVVSTQIPKRDRQEVLEEYLLALVVQNENPHEINKIVAGLLKDFVFKTQAYIKILEKLNTYLLSHTVYNNKDFLTTLSPELLPAFDACFLLPLALFEDAQNYEKEVRKTIADLRSFDVRARMKLLGEEVRHYEKEGNIELVEKKQQELTDLTKSLKIT